MLYGGGMLGLAILLFWIWAIVDVVTTPSDAPRNLPKIAWVFIVLLFWVIGAFAWVALGRPYATSGARSDVTDPPPRPQGPQRPQRPERPPRPPRRRQAISDERAEAQRLSEQERLELERREYYRRMDAELDRRLEEKSRHEGGEAPAGQ